VQRLFTMFPLGVPGIALLILRVCVAASLHADGTARWSPVTSPSILLVIVLTTICLILGLLTPFSASLCALLELSTFNRAGGQDIFHLVISVLTAATLAMLGPGAYSIDARIFGRRLLSVPPRHKTHSD
jgi:uncharacterized membrane protein YphA (DoxX/SURF4 family)